MKMKKPNDPNDAAVPVINKAIPWQWRILLAAALIIIPWFTKAAIWHELASRAGVASANGPSVKKTGTDKWGDLTLAPIVISPPMELVSTDWGEAHHPAWFFPNANADKAVKMLESAGVSAADAARLRTEAKAEPRIEGVVLTPDPDLVRSLTPETRAHVYAMLAECELNLDQVRPFMYPGTNPEDWLGSSLISPITRQLVEPLIYQEEGFMMFSDIDLVREEIGSDNELRRLSKALFRQPTVIAYLSVDPSTNLDGLVEYWGRGGRQTKIRSLIESVAEGDGDRFIDVVHLLPQFVQQRLYSYPTFSDADLNRQALVNCLWTSLNFFLEEPDDRFLNPEVAIKSLKEDYFIVKSDFQLGDIVAFLNEDGNIFHAAVYIAADLVFSKNGISSMAPWTLMSIDDVKGYYRLISEDTRTVVHRRKGIL